MPKSALFSSLLRMARDQAIAVQKNVSLATVADWRLEEAERKRVGGLSRRRFLAGSGAAAAALLAPRVVHAAAASPRIAIVGGGIAGLSCALELADHGLASTVYEANGRLGGRMYSNVNYFNDGQTTEWYGELIDTNHRTIRRLAKRFGLDVLDVRQAEPAGSEDTFYFFGKYYPRAQANKDFQAVHQELRVAIQGAGYPTTYNQSTAVGRALDNTSVYDWIDQHVPGGHGSPMGALLDAAYVEELAVSTQLQSSLNLIYLLGFNATPGNFEIYGKSDERFRIAGGNQQLPAAIASYLGASTVKTGWRMTSIARTADGRFTLSFDLPSTSRTVVADYVVLCIPFAILRALDYTGAGFDARKDFAIQNLGAGKSGKLQLQFTSRFWSAPGPWPGVSNGNTYADTGYQGTWDVTRAQTGQSGILVDYTGGPVSAAMTTSAPYAIAGDAGVDADAQQFLARLNPVFPGAASAWNGKATSSLPHLDPYLMLSYSHWKTGQYQTIAGYEQVRQGNCLFAGEHTSIDFQGFMEGGAFSGQRAANEVLADLK